MSGLNEWPQSVMMLTSLPILQDDSDSVVSCDNQDDDDGDRLALSFVGKMNMKIVHRIMLLKLLVD